MEKLKKIINDTYFSFIYFCLVLQYSLPNDFIRTPLGWLIVLMSQEIGNVCSCITVTVSMSLYSCLMIYLAAFLDDVSSAFRHLDGINAKRPQLGEKHKREIKLYFIETLNLHKWVLQ